MTIDVHAYIDEHFNNVLEDYKSLLRIPSISALRRHDPDSRRAAEFTMAMLAENGLEHTEIITTAGQPLVYADWLHADGKPTMLIYAHYDVQPVDPVEEWKTPPFEPTIQDGIIYARGASDDKLQVIATAHAVGALLDSDKSLPINVRFLFEGEEESGGEAIEQYVLDHPARLASDFVMVADGGLALPGQPTVYYGCRGVLYTEILAHGAAQDLHSGTFGGNAPNPLYALAHIITGLKDSDGLIHIPGLYELMTPVSAEEQAFWSSQEEQIPAELQQLMQTTITGEPAYTPIQRAWIRPTLEVHGIIGGFQDEGSKTVIPAEAKAKVSLRLVPGQTPANVFPLLQQRVAALTPPGIQAEVRLINGGLPFLTDYRSTAFQATRNALAEEYGVSCWISRGGGSIPISSIFQEALKGDVFVVGFGHNGDGAHSPNEHTDLANLKHAVHGFARILTAVGESKDGS